MRTALEPAGTPESKALQPLSIYASASVTTRNVPRLGPRLQGADVGAPLLQRLRPATGALQPLHRRGRDLRFAALERSAARRLRGWPQSRDFVHVTDIAAGVEAALEAGRGDFRAINLGTGVSTSVLRVAEVLARELDVDVEPELRQEYRAGDIRHCFADISLAQRELGYEPRVAFDDGMSELAAWPPTKRQRIAWRRRPQRSSSAVSPAKAGHVAAAAAPRVRLVTRLCGRQGGSARLTKTEPADAMRSACAGDLTRDLRLGTRTRNGLPIFLDRSSGSRPHHAIAIGQHQEGGVVDLGRQLRDRLPAKVDRDVRANVEVDARYEEIPTWAVSCAIFRKAPFGTRCIHVAEEVVRNHEALNPSSSTSRRSAASPSRHVMPSLRKGLTHL